MATDAAVAILAVAVPAHRFAFAEAHTILSSPVVSSQAVAAKIAEFAGVSVPNENLNFEKDFYPFIFDALFRSESWIAIVMITDLLGRKERFNVPGTAANSNWIRRLHSTVTRLAISPTVKRRMRLVRSLLEKSGRA
jgi:4-alpha-glucanotransferase